MANTMSVFSYYFSWIFKEQHEYETAIIHLRQNLRLILKKGGNLRFNAFQKPTQLSEKCEETRKWKPYSLIIIGIIIGVVFQVSKYYFPVFLHSQMPIFHVFQVLCIVFPTKVSFSRFQIITNLSEINHCEAKNK